MNAKKRVLAAFNREKADRVPLDYSANPVIHDRIAKHFNAKKYEEVLKALDIDFRGIWVEYTGKPLFNEIQGTKVDPVYGFYTRWAKNESGGYWDFCNFPLQNADSEFMANYPVANPDNFDYSKVPELIKVYGEYGIFTGNAGIADIINGTGRVMGMEDTLVNILMEDEATLHYINRVANMQLGVCERILNAAKGKIDFFWMGEDLGTQNAPIISLNLYRKVLRPIHQKFIDLAKSFKLPVMIHTCGSSSWVYNDFIDMGIDAVDTLQPEAVNMSPKYLKDNFEGRLSFHGCISTAGPLAYGTVKDVEEQVIQTLDILKPTYSYMLSPTHMIQDNSPVENVLAMYDFAKKYGRY